MKNILDKRFFALLLIFGSLMLLDIICNWRNPFAVNINGWGYNLLYIWFPWTAFLLSFHFLLGKWSRWIYIPLFVYLFVVESINEFTRINFHMVLDGDLYGIVVGSSFAELKEFLMYYLNLPMLIGVVVWIAIFVVCLRLIVKLPDRHPSLIGCAVACLCFVPLVWREPVFTRPVTVIKSRTAFRMIPSILDSISFYENLKTISATYSDLPEHLPLRLGIGGRSPVVVFVLGESATRNNWSLYGYEKRKTTPCMDAIQKNDLAIFKDVVAPFSGTFMSTRYVLTGADLDRGETKRYTLGMICHRAGYQTSFFSNQNHWGAGDCQETYFFYDARPAVWMQHEAEHTGFDSDLLPYMNQQLATYTNQPIAVFLHLSGSHHAAWERYPTDRERFKVTEKISYTHPSNDMAAYDNSIAFTDEILGQIVVALQEVNGPTLMIYLPDHGDTPRSDGWRVASDNDCWEIPFIVWASKEYQESYPDVWSAMKMAEGIPLQSDQFLPAFVRMMGISGVPSFTDEMDFLNPSFKPRKVRRLGDHDYKPKDAK